MESCQRCGARRNAGAAWCGQCLAPYDAPPPPPAPQPAAATRHVPPPPPALPSSREGSRWVKSDTTYGPFGRIVATILLILPTLWFISIATFGISLGGLVVWGGVIMPMGLRHVWAKVPGR